MPTVEASIGGVTTPILNLDLEVRLEISTVTLIIEGGQIVDRAPGPAMAAAKLSASGAVLAEQELTVVDLAPRRMPVLAAD